MFFELIVNAHLRKSTEIYKNFVNRLKKTMMDAKKGKSFFE
ncbi:hypothetical protein GTCCBUS3UF5_22570 [Geobacillus thermoleovorans CCB_US3_UF5]|uniref:Uncharacterized protein n=2 Tax=Geobacillus thermoleovorans group TaxID=1505648 RepID=U2WT76_GEOKU|nr:hypothetical protein GTCCBUS3UF5_22570 [Geobacillus thermoleovorans CCB_US3_UF5]GAD13976.1 hypothetical protein GBL_2193 [Geobacillus kaustophilus GBlys]